MSTDKHNIYKIFGKAILLSSISFSIASVEMSSKFSVINFSKDQDTLDNAIAALKEYILIGAFWAIGCVLVLYANHGMKGAIAGFVCNIFVLSWIWLSYQRAFSSAKLKNGL
jgi:hypothetical protein